MIFYEHHIGDWESATAHLSLLEEAVYSRLARIYYRTEKPIPADVTQACRLVRAVTRQEREAVRIVLEEFFVLGPDGWHNKRCDAEIVRYQEKREKAARSADARWKRGAAHTEGSADGMRTHTEGSADGMLSSPQSPDTKHQEKGDTPPTPPPPDGGDEPKHPSPPDGLFAEFWAAYPRKVGKEAARKAWRRVTRPAETLQAIQAALQWQCQSEQWSRHNGQFIPHPATYLSEQRWLDEPPRAQVVTLTQTGQRAVSAAQRWLETQEASA